LESLKVLSADFDWVVNCAASGGGGAAAYEQTYLTGNRNLLEWLRPSPPRQFIYTSSTSVYAQDDGSPVSEADLVEPGTQTGKILVATEQLLLSAVPLFPATILRLAGIYGPERGYWLRNYLSGEASLDGDGGRFLNMVHRDDVVGAVVAALQRASGGEVFNVVDDEPVSQRAVFEWLASRLGQPHPAAAPENVARGRPRLVTNKRVSNLRFKTKTNYSFKYPSFREGYEAEIQCMLAAGQL
jgi:nucleoside-diphosphate-sugar epimerase